MKKICRIVALLLASFCVLFSNNYTNAAPIVQESIEEISEFSEFTESGLPLVSGYTANINGGEIIFEVSQEEIPQSIIAEANKKLSAEFGESLKLPKAICSANFLTNVRGFAYDGCIWIQHDDSDLLSTLIHEQIHLQNDKFTYADGIGQETMEAIVEAITVEMNPDIDRASTTPVYQFWISKPFLKSNLPKLTEAFKAGKTAEEAYQAVFGENAKEVVQLLDNWSELSRDELEDLQARF